MMNLMNHHRDTDGQEDPILKVAKSWGGGGWREGGGEEYRWKDEDEVFVETA